MNRYFGVTTTGIYCREGCGARPKVRNVHEYTSAAGAEADGYRACLRCRPYRSDSIPDVGPELVCRAVHLIVSGALDESDEPALSARLAISPRHLRRLFLEHLGVTPDGLARSRRAHFARRLIDDTDLSQAQIAFASGFGSIRQYNRALNEIFRASPRELRSRRRKTDRLVADGGLALRLSFRPPLDWSGMLAFFAARAIAGVESVQGDTYRRTIEVEGQPGIIELSPGGSDFVLLKAHLPYWEGLIHVVGRARRIFNLDVDAETANEFLSADPLIGGLVRAGFRPPGTWDPFETAVRAIVGQRVSVKAASTIIGRLAARFGRRIRGLESFGLDKLFPSAGVLASANMHGLGLPGARAQSLTAFARAVDSAGIRLDRSQGLDDFTGSIKSIPGLGEWTAQYLALRLGEPDAFPATDLGLRRAYERLGSERLEIASRRWSPWRAFAATQLWMS